VVVVEGKSLFSVSLLAWRMRVVVHACSQGGREGGREGGSAGSCTCSPVRATRGKALRREWELAIHSALPASKRSSRGRGHACRQVELSSCWPHGMAVCMAALGVEGCTIDQQSSTSALTVTLRSSSRTNPADMAVQTLGRSPSHSRPLSTWVVRARANLVPGARCELTSGTHAQQRV
jgi:hypothetical protein